MISQTVSQGWKISVLNFAPYLPRLQLFLGLLELTAFLLQTTVHLRVTTPLQTKITNPSSKQRAHSTNT